MKNKIGGHDQRGRNDQSTVALSKISTQNCIRLNCSQSNGLGP